MRLAQQLDPLSPTWNTWAYSCMAMAGQVGEGIAGIENVVAMHPQHWIPRETLSFLYSVVARLDDARMTITVPSPRRHDMYEATMRRAIVIIAVALVCLTGSAGAQTQAPAKVDVTGAWAFEVQIQGGSGTPQVTFKQDGEKLTGHYSSPLLGEADLTGTVKGQAIEFSMTINVQGNSLSVTYSGTVEDNNAMKGTVTFAGFGDGTFSGKRK